MSSIHDKIDELESKMIEYPFVECPLVHRFTPGMYIREIFMPAGSMVTSMIHKTEHPFVVSMGIVNVLINEEVQTIEAPYCGITKPGTRRVLYCVTDVVWTTFHAIDIKPEDNSEKAVLKAVQLIESLIIEPHENPLLGGIIKNNVLTETIKS